MLNNFQIIEQMDEETLLKNVDNFLQFWGIDSSNTEIKQKRKLLKKLIERLDADSYHAKYCMNYTSDEHQLKEYSERISTNKQVIGEIEKYISCLPSTKNKIFWKKRK